MEKKTTTRLHPGTVRTFTGDAKTVLPKVIKALESRMKKLPAKCGAVIVCTTVCGVEVTSS